MSLMDTSTASPSSIQAEPCTNEPVITHPVVPSAHSDLSHIKNEIRLWVEYRFKNDADAKTLLSYLLFHLEELVSDVVIMRLVPGRFVHMESSIPLVKLPTMPNEDKDPDVHRILSLPPTRNLLVKFFADSLSAKLDRLPHSPILLKVDEWGNCILMRKSQAANLPRDPDADLLATVLEATSQRVEQTLSENLDSMRNSLDDFVKKYILPITFGSAPVNHFSHFVVHELSKRARPVDPVKGTKPLPQSGSTLHLSVFAQKMDEIGLHHFREINLRELLRLIAAEFKRFSTLHAKHAFEMLIHEGEKYEIVIHPDALRSKTASPLNPVRRRKHVRKDDASIES